MSGVLSEIINILTGGLTGMASGIAGGLNSMVTDLFIVTDATTGTQSLSVFGGVVAIFGGIA